MAIFCLSDRFFLKKNTPSFLTEYQEIAVKDFFVGEAHDIKGDYTFASPLAPEGMIARYISPSTPGLINFNFKKPISFNSFSISFYGDMHSVSSTIAKDFQVYYKDLKKGDWRLADEIKNFSSSVYQFHSPETIESDAVRIVISKAAFYDAVHYGDVKFFKTQKVNFWEWIKLVINSQKRSLLGRWVYYLIFLMMLFLPGLALMNFFQEKKKIKFDSETKLIFSPVFSLVVMALSVSVYYILGIKIIFTFYWVIFLVSLIYFILNFRSRFLKEVIDSSSLLILISAALILIFLVMAERDYLYNLPYLYNHLDKIKPIPMSGYRGFEADNLFQWGIARMFLHRFLPWSAEAKQFLLGAEAISVFDRTPVLPLVTAFILNFFGESHFVYQRFLEVLTLLYFGAFYLVFKKYYSKPVAKVISLTVLLNVSLFFRAFNAEFFFKYFSLFPILLALAAFFNKRKSNGAIIGGLMGLAFLIHPLNLIFFIAVFLLYFLRYKLSFQLVRKTIFIFVFLALLIGSWYFVFEKVKSISGTKTPSIYLTNIKEIGGQTIFYKLTNFINLFVPNSLLRDIKTGYASFNSRDYWLAFLQISLVSNLTPVFLVLILIYLAKNYKKDYQILILGVFPLIFFLIFYLHQYLSYERYILLYPFVVPFLIAYVVGHLARGRRIIRVLALGSYVIFMSVNLYFISSAFIRIKCSSSVVYHLFWGVLSMYFILSVNLLKYSLSDFNKNH